MIDIRIRTEWNIIFIKDKRRFIFIKGWRWKEDNTNTEKGEKKDSKDKREKKEDIHKIESSLKRSEEERMNIFNRIDIM